MSIKNIINNFNNHVPSPIKNKTTLSYNPFLTNLRRPLIIAHGGAKKLFPGNSMIAFDGAVKMGVDVLEMDIRLTKDYLLITHHDSTIDRTSNGQGPVKKYTYEELTAFNFGYNFEDLCGRFPYRNEKVRVTLLEDVMKKYNGYPMIIEIKDKGVDGKKTAEILKNTIYLCHMENRIIVSSFNDSVLQYFRKITFGKVMTASARAETIQYLISHLLHTSQMHSFQMPYKVMQLPSRIVGMDLAKNALVRELHKRHIAVQYWTINEKEEMKKLLELGADGLITDRPDLMQEVLREMGFKL